MFGGSISIAPALTPEIETPPLHLTATNSLVMFLSVLIMGTATLISDDLDGKIDRTKPGRKMRISDRIYRSSNLAAALILKFICTGK
jgi:hypothetical protein